MVGGLLTQLQELQGSCSASRLIQHQSYHMLRLRARYGYVERIHQGNEFVASLLDRVIGLLLKSLQERLADSAALRSDLGFTDVFPVPARASC